MVKNFSQTPYRTRIWSAEFFYFSSSIIMIDLTQYTFIKHRRNASSILQSTRQQSYSQTMTSCLNRSRKRNLRPASCIWDSSASYSGLWRCLKSSTTQRRIFGWSSLWWFVYPADANKRIYHRWTMEPIHSTSLFSSSCTNQDRIMNYCIISDRKHLATDLERRSSSSMIVDWLVWKKTHWRPSRSSTLSSPRRLRTVQCFPQLSDWSRR